MTDTPQPASARPRRLSPITVGLATGVVYFLLALGVIFSGRIPARVAYDDLMYHEPTIREFARQWPRFYFYDYLSATTPGYHLLLATIAKFVSPARAVLQGVSALIGAGLVGFFASRLTRPVGPLWACLLTLPLAASSYVFQSTTYLLPDNSSWLLMLLGVLLCVREWSPGVALRLGLVAAMGVMMRQPLIWLAAPALVSAWLSVAPHPLTHPAMRPLLLEKPGTRIGRAAFALLCMLPAILILGAFARLWHGLTPPRFQHQHQGFGLSTPLFVLANLGLFSVFFTPLLWPLLKHAWSRARGSLLTVVAAAALLGVVEPSTLSEPEGRFSGLWNIGAKFPHVGEVSLLIFALGLAGGAALLCWMMVFPFRQRLILLACLAAFTAAQTANHLTLQRYVEPFLLMLIPLAATRALEVLPRPRRPMLVLGIVALVAYLGAINLFAFRDWSTPETYPKATTVIEGGPFVPPEQRPDGPHAPLPSHP